MLATYPVQGLTLDLAVRARQSATRLRIVCAVNGSYIAVLVLITGMLLVTLDDVGVLQAHLLAGSKTHKLLLCLLHEVIALNPDLTAKLNGMCTIGLVLGIVDGCQLLRLSLRIVGDDHLHRIQNG